MLDKPLRIDPFLWPSPIKTTDYHHRKDHWSQPSDKNCCEEYYPELPKFRRITSMTTHLVNMRFLEIIQLITTDSPNDIGLMFNIVSSNDEECSIMNDKKLLNCFTVRKVSIISRNLTSSRLTTVNTAYVSRFQARTQLWIINRGKNNINKTENRHQLLRRMKPIMLCLSPTEYSKIINANY